MQVPSPPLNKKKKRKESDSSTLKAHRDFTSVPSDLDIHVRFPRKDVDALFETSPPSKKERRTTPTPTDVFSQRQERASDLGRRTPKDFFASSDEEMQTTFRNSSAKPSANEKKMGPDMDAMAQRMIKAEARTTPRSLPPTGLQAPLSARSSTTNWQERIPAIQQLIAQRTAKSMWGSPPQRTSRSDRSARRSSS
eukprot:GHVP01053094.1.p1 GENE.GHVP01053094.1~~GHVP01053094.1.p1  ORF type:complete len:195 (+),score=43.72 GHVP01053094.1:1168-1752(+)